MSVINHLNYKTYTTGYSLATTPPITQCNIYMVITYLSYLFPSLSLSSNKPSASLSSQSSLKLLHHPRIFYFISFISHYHIFCSPNFDHPSTFCGFLHPMPSFTLRGDSHHEGKSDQAHGHGSGSCRSHDRMAELEHADGGCRGPTSVPDHHTGAGKGAATGERRLQ